jgi:hypothetical protein
MTTHTMISSGSAVLLVDMGGLGMKEPPTNPTQSTSTRLDWLSKAQEAEEECLRTPGSSQEEQDGDLEWRLTSDRSLSPL